jgi:hypothetical protein
MKFILFLLIILGGMQVNGHEFTPAYPKLEPAYIEGVLVAKMELFNRRNDVTFYDLSVFDAEWNPVPFATTNKIIEVQYLQRKYIEIYIRERDKNKVVYICSKSKLNSVGEQVAIISSRICSKIK